MSATISQCGRYRYTLHRRVLDWTLAQRRACVIMVNPSTADAETNDATIRKLIGFAERAAWSEFTVVNKFAFRATDVNMLRIAADPVGPANNHHIIHAIAVSDVVVVAWGSLNKLPPQLQDRWKRIVGFAQACRKPLFCWGTCDDGHPRHPVMLGYDTPLVPWEPPL